MATASAIWIGVTAVVSYFEASHRNEQRMELVIAHELAAIEEPLERRAEATQAVSSSLYIIADAKALFSGNGNGKLTLDQLVAELSVSLELSYMAVISTTGSVLTAASPAGEFNEIVGKNLFNYANVARFQASDTTFLAPATDPFLKLALNPSEHTAADSFDTVTQWALVPIREEGRTYGWLLLSTNWQTATNALLDKARESLIAFGLSATGVYIELQNGSKVASSPRQIDTAEHGDLIIRSLKLSPALQGLQLTMAVDRSMVRAQVKEDVLSSLAFASCALLIMLFLFNWVFQRLVLDRISALKRATVDMVGAEHARQVEVVYDDELGALERAYNDMSHSLHQSHITLEDTVAARTSALAEALSQMESFNYIASHDLCEPIRTVQTYCELLRMDLLHVPKAAETDLRFIEGAIGRMGELVNDLLLYSRNRSQSLSTEMLSLKSVFDEICADHRVIIAESNAKIEYGQLHSVYADNEQLRHVCRNLLTNAIKYCDPNTQPHVFITSRVVNEMVEVRVRDNGIGISAEHHQQIFEPFKRLHDSRVYKGTGIGLAVVAESVLRHGGSIKLESSLGKGSTFIVTFPRATEPCPALLQQSMTASDIGSKSIQQNLAA